MTARWGKYAAIVAAALLLLAMGAALRPALVPSSAAEESGIRLSAADVGFAQDMAVHHEQALSISQNLDRTVAPEIGQLADQIAAKQTMEIGTLRGWLTLADEPWTPSEPMAWMHTERAAAAHGHGAHVEPVAAQAMPGLATWDEINTLAGLTGRDAETYFLQLMIRHHRGGIDMAAAAVTSNLADPIDRTVASMVRDQGQELGYMNLLLQQRQTEPLPYP